MEPLKQEKRKSFRSTGSRFPGITPELVHDIKAKYGNKCIVSGVRPSSRCHLELVEIHDDDNASDNRELWELYVPVLRKFAKGNNFVLPKGYTALWREKVLQIKSSTAAGPLSPPSGEEEPHQEGVSGDPPSTVADGMAAKMLEFKRQRVASVA